jgi:ABC-type uncharacterized transport system permease subunit
MKVIFIIADLTLVLSLTLFLAFTALVIGITTNTFVFMFYTLSLVLGPVMAFMLDKEYVQALFQTKRDTAKFPWALFAIRFYFMFAWVIPQLALLLLLFPYRLWKLIVRKTYSAWDEFCEITGW